MHDKAARGQGPGRACEAAARGQAAHLPSSLRQQAGREGPQEKPFAVLRNAPGASRRRGFIPCAMKTCT